VVLSEDGNKEKGFTHINSNKLTEAPFKNCSITLNGKKMSENIQILLLGASEQPQEAKQIL